MRILKLIYKNTLRHKLRSSLTILGIAIAVIAFGLLRTVVTAWGRLARYLIWWLLFRLMFLSGVVKLTSGDIAWRHLTALTFHYQTQPLPTPLAWYAQQFPEWFQKASCAAMFAIELTAPLCIPGPRTLRHI